MFTKSLSLIKKYFWTFFQTLNKFSRFWEKKIFPVKFRWVLDISLECKNANSFLIPIKKLNNRRMHKKEHDGEEDNDRLLEEDKYGRLVR